MNNLLRDPKTPHRNYGDEVILNTGESVTIIEYVDDCAFFDWRVRTADGQILLIDDCQILIYKSNLNKDSEHTMIEVKEVSKHKDEFKFKDLLIGSYFVCKAVPKTLYCKISCSHALSLKGQSLICTDYELEVYRVNDISIEWSI